MPKIKLPNQVAIIVGGASGMGATTALRFAREVARVVIADIDENKLSEWANHGVHVNCICPGAAATPMLLESTSEEYREERSTRIPLHRFGKPEEQASVILFLGSSDSDYVTDSVTCTDGGVHALVPATGTDAISGCT